MRSEIWRTIFDAIREPAFLHDAQYRLTLANGAYCRATETARDAIVILDGEGGRVTAWNPAEETLSER